MNLAKGPGGARVEESELPFSDTLNSLCMGIRGDRRVFSVGHSTLFLVDFVELLKPYEVRTIVDVRSSPISRFAPEFEWSVLEGKLPDHGIRYVFLGNELGGRPRSSAHYDDDGRALYYKMANAPAFVRALDLLEENLDKSVIALMCSEGKPHECHRHLLIERALKPRGILMTHILPDGSTYEFATTAVEERTLFEQAEDTAWKSVRSVLPGRAQNASSTY